MATHRREYGSWHEMMRRCYVPTHQSFVNYGGRGIGVCKRWRKFANFLADMGECPTGLTLERINNNRGYSPANCRWATYKEQNANKRSNGWNKLTRADARAIRADPRRHWEIALDYNVTRSMISYIKRRECFADVGGRLTNKHHPHGTPGEKHRNAKLTDKQVLAMRTQHANGRTIKSIATEAGMNRTTIWNIVSRRSWKHI